MCPVAYGLCVPKPCNLLKQNRYIRLHMASDLYENDVIDDKKTDHHGSDGMSKDDEQLAKLQAQQEHLKSMRERLAVYKSRHIAAVIRKFFVRFFFSCIKLKA